MPIDLNRSSPLPDVGGFLPENNPQMMNAPIAGGLQDCLEFVFESEETRQAKAKELEAAREAELQEWMNEFHKNKTFPFPISIDQKNRMIDRYQDLIQRQKISIENAERLGSQGCPIFIPVEMLKRFLASDQEELEILEKFPVIEFMGCITPEGELKNSNQFDPL